MLAAIDVGTNAVRLQLARAGPDGSLDIFHQERDPIRPGEGVFRTGAVSEEAAERLLSTLRRYGALCRRYRARVRAVATAALREAKNRAELVLRVREEAGLTLEVVSGREEARLICLGVLAGRPPLARSLCVDIGGGSTEIAHAIGERPTQLWSVALGAVHLCERFDAAGKVTPGRLRLMRAYVRDVLSEALPAQLKDAPRHALGSSGTIQAVVAFAASEGTAHATLGQLEAAVALLARLGPEARRKRFERHRADIILPGALILEAVARHLSVESVVAVDRGLRDGLLLDLVRKGSSNRTDRSLSEAAVELGRRFHFDEPHGVQVSRLALTLFDGLAALHRLPAAGRPYLEVAALLHDIGSAISYERHHRHSHYLIQHADIPGLADGERGLVARIARYHRRSAPEPSHPGMAGLDPASVLLVRGLATLLRVADSLDRGHRQLVERLEVRCGRAAVDLELHSPDPLDLELWDTEEEAETFRRVFGRSLRLHVRRTPAR